MSEIYRLATLEDAEELLDVTLRAYEPIRQLGIRFPAATANIELVQDNITNNDCYVLEKDGSIIATVTVAALEEVKEVTDLPFIWWFAVDPAYKGKGFGTKLLSWVEKNIIRDTLKAPAVTLATAERHPWLVPMYERKGYERFYEVDKEGEKIVFMRKILNPDLFSKYNQEKTDGSRPSHGLHA
ncbi:GNAT family N-acetyltransferase [Thermoflavimicrobium dichotomicum]|uniref:N-acetylglutamate synthase, GNAT family n=1 Tax=Thermoflavimicrobium dichotomicum TaxID=46223 RepID=A0A1I3U5V0_9BACL|nr:GNAT family N-acetyltransferase [Thermoflavimicrobium dichotomicum]SFJ77157.1 N-acetylglutamate synthase, GNAT family [Thermoflavimicrobium dichotomicum]